MNPLVKQGVIPKRLTEVFVSIPPPKKTKSKTKVVKTAKIITSEEVRAEVEEIDQRKQQKSKSKKMPQIVLHDKTNNTESDVESSDESVCEMESVCGNESLHDTESEINITNGDYVIVKYAGKRRKLYYAAVVNEVHADEDMYVVAFFKCNGKYLFLFDEKHTDEVGRMHTCKTSTTRNKTKA